MTIKEAEAILKDKGIDENRIKEIRDYSYSLSREIIKNNINDYIEKVNNKNI